MASLSQLVKTLICLHKGFSAKYFTFLRNGVISTNLGLNLSNEFIKEQPQLTYQGADNTTLGKVC